MKQYGIALLAMLLLLSGCTRREYLSVKPHEEQYVEQENADATVISDYDGLVAALLQQCSRHEESGLIRVYGYPGEIVDDVSDAVYYVAKQSALGTYAVDFITYDCTQVVSYYEISVDITYTKTLEEMQELIGTRGENAIQLRVGNALKSYAPTLALRIYNTPVYDVEGFVREFYEQNPGHLQACPQVELSYYPKNVATEEYILQINFTYPHSQTLMLQHQQAVDTVVGAAVEYVQHRESEKEKLELLYVYLAERFDYEEVSSELPVYAALCEGRTDSYAAARTVKTLCDAIGLTCWVVDGTYHDTPWYWNIVSLDGQYYHVDAMRCISAGQMSLSMDLDSGMSLYSWTRADYPACTLRPDGGIDMREDAEDNSGEFGENLQPTP